MALTAEQRRNLAIARGMTRGDSQRVRMALLEAMKVESNFRHLHYGDRDSQGILQQRPSQGWGPYIPGDRGVRQDISDFLQRARRTDKGFRGSPGQLAQAVQRSAFPERYDQQAGLARSLLGGPAASPGLQLAGRLSGSQSLPGASQGGNAVALGLLASSNELAAGRMPDPGDFLRTLAEQRQLAEQPSMESQTLAANVQTRTGSHAGITGGSKGIHELFYDPIGGIDEGRNISAIGGHSDHVHVSLASERAQRAALAQAKRLGLRVGEESDSDVHPVHTSGSWHYKNYRKGDPLRMAADVSGDSARMAAFYRWVARNYR